MNTAKLFVAVLLMLPMTGCAMKNRVLIGQQFIGAERTVKIVMSQPKGDSDDRTVDQYMRICTLKSGQEVDCKDTLILENVRPGSLY